MCSQELINNGVSDSDFSECEKYIGTRNANIEKGIIEIVNLEIKNQKEKNNIISIKEIIVFNQGEKSQGMIFLNCDDDLDYEIEEEIIKNIAEQLFEKYLEEYSENAIRHSSVSVNCVYDLGWGISEGDYGMAV